MAETRAPQVLVLAGPNGAGKSTLAPYLLRDAYHVPEFVNADTLAAGLSAFDPESAAIQAGRLMGKRLKELAAARESFAFETTLAARSFAGWLSALRENGYETNLIFLWLSSADLAVERVAERVAAGGHIVDEQTIRRRYERALRNLNQLYFEVCDGWSLYDNSGLSELKLVATGGVRETTSVLAPDVWTRVLSYA